MYKATTDISIERLLEEDIPELVGFNNDIVMMNTLGDFRLFSHPARLRGCLKTIVKGSEFSECYDYGCDH